MLLGSGSFGKVWLRNGVAQKLISFSSVVSPFAELTMMSCLQHENVVRFLGGVFLTSEGVFYNMEHMSEGSLEKFIETEIRPQSVLERLAIDMARAIYFLHQNSIVHADVSPRNFLVHFNGERYIAKISDFGRSFFSDEMTYGCSGIYYHRNYRAPEMWPEQDEEFGYAKKHNFFAADIWALGMCYSFMDRRKPTIEKQEDITVLNGFFGGPFGAGTIHGIEARNRLFSEDIFFRTHTRMFANMLRYKPEERLSAHQILFELKSGPRYGNCIEFPYYSVNFPFELDLRIHHSRETLIKQKVMSLLHEKLFQEKPDPEIVKTITAFACDIYGTFCTGRDIINSLTLTHWSHGIELLCRNDIYGL